MYEDKMSAMDSAYIGKPPISKGGAAAASFIESLKAELCGIETMLDAVSSALHSQADRIFGSGPSDVAETKAGGVPGGPAVDQIGDQIRCIRRLLTDVNGAVQRLRQIG